MQELSVTPDDGILRLDVCLHSCLLREYLILSGATYFDLGSGEEAVADLERSNELYRTICGDRMYPAGLLRLGVYRMYVGNSDKAAELRIFSGNFWTPLLYNYDT